MPRKNKKPKWGKPKLIILIRGKPEESVLTVCKNESLFETGSDNVETGCQRPIITICNSCDEWTQS